MDKQQREYIHHLMLQYSDAMVRLTYRRVGDWHLAEDLVQETFLTACCKSERVCGHKKPVAWLFETLNNLTLRESRRFYHMRRMTMKRRLFSLFLMLIMMFSVGMTASAVYRPEIGMPTINGTRSSAYLDGYSVGIEARGNGKIAVAMTVEARSKMEKLGVHEVEIEQKVNGNWRYYDSQYGAEHPEFYDYNTWDYVGTTYFQGTPGVSYRVTLTVYARNSKGSDTGYNTSYTVVCR